MQFESDNGIVASDDVTIGAVLAERLNRRALLRRGVGGAAAVFGAAALSACGGGDEDVQAELEDTAPGVQRVRALQASAEAAAAMPPPLELQTLEYAHNVASENIPFEILDSVDRALAVEITGKNPGTVAIWYEGVALQLVPGSQASAGSSSSRRETRLYLYPGQPPIGKGTLSVNAAVGNTLLRIVQRAGVNRQTPLRAQGSYKAVSAASASATNSSLNVATAAGDLVQDLIVCSKTPVAGTGQQLVGNGRSRKVANSTSAALSWSFATAVVAHSAVAWVGSGASQPFPKTFTGARGKRSWALQSNLVGETVSAGQTVCTPAVTSVESGALANPAAGPRHDDTFYRRAGTVSRPAIRIAANSTTSPSTVTLLVNGIACGVVVTIAAGQTGWLAGSGVVHIGAGDGLIWRITNGGGGALTITMQSHVFEADTAETVSVLRAYSSSNTQFPQATTGFLRPGGSRGYDALEANGALRMPFAAALEGLEVKKTGNYFTACSLDVVVRVNGADRSQALHWPARDQSVKADLVHVDPVNDGDLVSLRLTSSTTSGETNTEEIEALTVNAVTANGEHLLVTGAQSASSVAIPAGTSYIALCGELKTVGTQAAAEAVTPIPLAISRLAAEFRTNTGTARTDFYLVVDDVETDLRISARPGVSNDRRDDLHHVIQVPAGKRVCLKAVNGAINNAVKVRSLSLVAVEMA